MSREALEHCDEPLVQQHDLLVLDLDGVVYVGADAVPGAVDSLTAARATGVGWCFATNNASRTPGEVARHLRDIGLPVGPDDVLTSSQAAARLVVDRCGAGASVLPVGGPGVLAACVEAGLQPVSSAADHPAAVVQGYGRHISWEDLAEAAYAVQSGAWWVATNTDATLPTERGPAPGNGTLVAAVRAATGVDPVVAGKPEPGLFRTAARLAGSGRPLVVGDRLDTDLAGAVRADQHGLLVLTGVSRAADLLRAPADQRPTYVAEDLWGLLAPQPATVETSEGWRCGDGVVRWADGTLEGEAPEGVAGSVDLLRAACAAVWSSDVAAAPSSVSAELHARWETLGRG